MDKLMLAYHFNLPLVEPRIVNLGLTHRCNLQCKICHTRDNSPQPEMSTKQVKDLIDSMADWKDTMISFAGGEPLLRKDIFEIIEYTAKKGLKTHLTTNAILIGLQKSLAYKLVGSGLSSVSVSLDGFKEETNDYIRGRGTYKKILKSLEYLTEAKESLKSGIKIGLTTVVTDKNLEELLELLKIREKYGLYEINYNPYNIDNSFVSRSNYDYDDEFWIPKGRVPLLKSVCDKLIKIKRDAERKNSHIHIIGTPYFTLEMMPQYFLQKENFRQGKCLAGHTYMYVKPNGEVDVCGKGPSFSLRKMNVKHKNIKDIWRSLNFFITRLKISRCKNQCLMLCFDRRK